MSIQIFQVSGIFIELAIGLWLYCHTLPKREGFTSRIVIAVLCGAGLTALSIYLGFSMHPPLTDDASFVRAILSFTLILGFATAAVLLAWDTSFLAALFCSSSAYLLQDMAYAVDRVLHLTHVVPQAPFTDGGIPQVPLPDVLSALFSATIVFVLFYLLFIRRLNKRGLEGINNGPMLLTILVAILVSIVFDLALKDLPTFNIPWRYPVVLSIVHLSISAFILVAEFEIIYNGSLKSSVSTMEHIVKEQEHQYELAQQTIDAINRRVHDMRHHVFSILTDKTSVSIDRSQLREIAREMQVYDSSIKTGTAALDVVLTEKGLLCGQEGITLTCVADGEALDFMAASDIYTLFGTAVDGAIAAVKSFSNESGQAISLNVREAMGMASISIEHYLVSPDEIEEEKAKDGEQRLDTLRTIVERYGGTFVLDEDSMRESIFHFDALIPIP